MLAYIIVAILAFSTFNPYNLEGQYTSINATYTIRSQSDVVYPSTAREITITISPVSTVDMVVVLFHVTSPITEINGETDCEYSQDITVCRFYNINSDFHKTLYMSPFGVSVKNIVDAQSMNFYVGTPFSIYENGNEVAYEDKVWSPYTPIYKTYLPLISND